ncbi:MAG: glycosyltransferase family 4 protein [Oscillatoriales cyanobacterium SM2_2_1]|nr:glycosyltransferase family 4 protein [Oscillatoriales cyanobacterium SM2_2_1]
MQIVLACNNNWGQGGQGNFLQRAALGLHQGGAHSLTVYCSGTAADTATGIQVLPQGYSWASQRLMATPLLRRRRDWATLWADLYFDRQVAQHITQGTGNLDLFVGVAGQCALSLRAAKQRGATVWLYCLNTYLPFMQAQIAQECRFLGEQAIATMHPKMLSRFAEEGAIADQIVVNSEVAKGTFVAAGVAPERIVVILPVVDCQRFRPAARNEEPFRVLFLGTLDPRKGVHYLVPAFREAAIPGAELLLVGGYSTRAMRLFLERTLLENPQVRQELWDVRQIDPPLLFGRCDVLVMPSVEDGFGVVALEGMASGLPVVVTEHCGAADVICRGENGFVVPPRDSGAIARVLGDLAADPQKRQAVGRQARATAEQHTQSRYDRDMAHLLQGIGA